ncbi:hypothetical protein SDC9_92455 [bioreactor metagenome]|uniref:Uncharacterized protein n=1 Tax=bioreactor metagenome TaxID=1076179 RepID=A0A645A4J7_9ZZZZ
MYLGMVFQIQLHVFSEKAHVGKIPTVQGKASVSTRCVVERIDNLFSLIDIA